MVISERHAGPGLSCTILFNMYVSHIFHILSAIFPLLCHGITLKHPLCPCDYIHFSSA